MKLRSKNDSRRGQAAIMMTMSIVVTLGLLGMVVDMGWAYWRKQAAKTAADAAVMGAVMSVANIHSFTCSTPDVVCQSDTACPADPVSPPANLMQSGCLYAKQNGFRNYDRQTVTMAGNIGLSPVTGVQPSYWVSATVTEKQPMLFSAILGQQWAFLRARSTAGIFTHPAGACIYALSPVQVGIKVNGGTQVNSACGMYVDSSDPAAFTAGGSSNISAKEIDVVGNWVNNGGAVVTPSPTTNAPVTPDPFAYVAPPNYDPGRCDSTGITETSTIIMPSDHRYIVCNGGFNMNSNKHLTLKSGIYILKGGGIDWKNGTLDADGPVTFYLTGGFAGISVNGTMDVNLSAPTTGAYRGLLFFLDRTIVLNTLTFNGGAGQQLNGTLYFPSSPLNYSGGSASVQTFTALVASQIVFIGTSNFADDTGGSRTGLGQPTIAWLE